MRRLALFSALILSLAAGTQAHAQDSSQTPPQTMYATGAANIREGAGTNYNVIGRIAAGQPVQIAGSVNGGFFPLASGGFVSASLLSPNPVTVVVRKVAAPSQARAYQEKPAAAGYRPGDCAPYERVINIAGQAPQQVRGTACMQPDGTWHIVSGNSGVGMQVPAPAVVAPPPQPGQPIYQTAPGQPVPEGAVPVQGLPWQR